MGNISPGSALALVQASEAERAPADSKDLAQSLMTARGSGGGVTWWLVERRIIVVAPELGNCTLGHFCGANTRIFFLRK